MKNKTEREEYLYHNTEKLLKKYRDIVWNIQVATMQAEEDFKKEMDCSIEEFLDMPYKVMDDLNGSAIERQMKIKEIKFVIFYKKVPLITVFICINQNGIF